MRFELYTDGAAVNNGKTGSIGYSALILAGKETLEFSGSELADPASSNLAELLAIRLALTKVRETGHRVTELLLFSDSEWGIRSIRGDQQANTHLELIAEIRAALRLLAKYELCWLRGHCGHRLQERAHTLANAAAWGCARRAGVMTMDERSESKWQKPVAASKESKWTRGKNSVKSSPAPLTQSSGNDWQRSLGVTEPGAKYREWLGKMMDRERYSDAAITRREEHLREKEIPSLQAQLPGVTSTAINSEWVKTALKCHHLREQMWAIQETLRRRAAGDISASMPKPVPLELTSLNDPFLT